MRDNQKLTPKYWVVHSTESDDIDNRTLSKNRELAINYWVEETYKERFGRLPDPDPEFRDETAIAMILGEFHEREDLDVSLIEIRIVDLAGETESEEASVAPGHPIIVALSIMSTFRPSDITANGGLTGELFEEVFWHCGVIGYRGIVEPVVSTLIEGLDHQHNDDTMVERMYRLWHESDEPEKLADAPGLGEHSASKAREEAPELAKQQIKAFRNVWIQWRMETPKET